MKISFRFALLLILNIIIFLIDDSKQQKSILIVMLYDGFQRNYLDRGITPTLNNFRINGVSSEYMRTVYPSNLRPSVHTIASGWGVRTHFRYTRYFADIDRSVQNNKSSFIDQEYIWGLNQINGGKSACICWPYLNDKPPQLPCTEQVDRTSLPTLRKRADKLIEVLNRTNEADIPNLVMLYADKLDKITHFFGPLSRNSSLFIRRFDLVTKYILSKLMEINMYHRANIIILSDHGVRPIIDHWNNCVFNSRRMMKMYPSSEDEEEINQFYLINNAGIKSIKIHLEAMDDFKAQEKNRWFTLARVPSGVNSTNSMIEFAACPGFAMRLDHLRLGDYQRRMKGLTGLKPPKWPGWGPRGVHGYVRQNDAFFMAKGPNLARFKTVEPFKMEDLYCAFAKLLHIQGDHEKDGNFSRIRAIFVESKPINWVVILVTIFGLAVIFCVIFAFLINYLTASLN